MNERGTMQAVYIKYRDMKRDIRHDAAIEIQRMFRGYKGRLDFTQRDFTSSVQSNQNSRLWTSTNSRINVKQISSKFIV